MKTIHRIFSIATLAVFALSMVHATSIFVATTGSDLSNGTSLGTPVRTITHGIGLAISNGATDINVAAGTYNVSGGESFPLLMPSGVTLTGTAGAATTIIDATGDSSRVFVCDGNSATTVIQGFTIKGGFNINYSSAGVVGKGGGIYITNNSQTIIQNNIITKNTVRGYDFHQAGAGALNGGSCYGGGIFVNSGTPTIRNNVISYNLAMGGGGQDYRGGFSGNGSAGGDADGAGINASFGGASTIINNTFYGNVSMGGKGGSSNSLNGGNGGNATAGGLNAGSNAIVKNNIFSCDTAVGGIRGGGANASDGTGTDGAITGFTAGNLSFNLYYNDVATTNSDGGTLGSDNVMASDPLFVSGTNFHFTSNSSPAYHAGTSSGAPATDFDGTSRGGTPSIGAFQGTDPLPVELVSFAASVKENTIGLGWRTATEVNNYGFEVERQNSESRIQNGIAEWTKIGFVEGAGTSNVPKAYSYQDEHAPSGKYQYRLKQIDRDGAFKYSQSIEAEVGAAPKAFGLSQNYPNPFNPSTTIEYSLASSEFVSVRVYDILGGEVASLINGRQEAGSYSVRLDASKLSSGFYYYTLSAGTSVSTKKMLLLK